MAFLKNANNVKVAAACTDESDGTERSKHVTMDTWVPGTAGNTTSLVEVSISCRNLADKDVLSKSDPMCVVYNRPSGSKSWVQMMRTEVIQNDLNPDFVEKVTLEYRFEQVQALRFEVYDIDSTTAKLSSQDSIGMVECTLGQIVSAGEDGLKLDLNNLKATIFNSDCKPGTIILIAEEVPAEKDEVTLKLAGHTVGSWTCCVPPKSYFAISKLNDAGIYLVVHRSRASRGTNPTWPILQISNRLLCNGDLGRQLKIDIIHQNNFTGVLSRVGHALTTTSQMVRQSGGQDKIPLMTDTSDPCRGSVRIVSCAVNPIHTFLDYLQNGMQIQCWFSIDFTCSNGDPTDMESLHYVSNSGNMPNPYEQAIQAVGTIMKDYDNTHLFPTYGFGARIPPQGAISHDFCVTLTNSPNCCSISGVLEAYRNCISKIQLYGPTNFAPMITMVTEAAKKNSGGGSYYILVIITDGVISDMAKTKKAIVEAAAYPISIIIIGVGEADFDSMLELDGDAIRISYKGKVAERDIVQFVAYRSARSWMTNTGENTMANFVQDVLATDGEKGGGVGIDGSTVTALGGGSSSDLGGGDGGGDERGSTGNFSASGSGVTSMNNLNVGGTPAVLQKSSTSFLEAPDGGGGEGGGSFGNKSRSSSLKFQLSQGGGGPPVEDKDEKMNRLAQGHLAQEVLAEIPRQICSYMKSKGIVPNMVKNNQNSQTKTTKDQSNPGPAVQETVVTVPTITQP